MKSSGDSRGGRALLLGLAGILVSAVGLLGIWISGGGPSRGLDDRGESAAEEPRPADLPGAAAGGTPSAPEGLPGSNRVEMMPDASAAAVSHAPRAWSGEVVARGTGEPVEGATVGARWAGGRSRTETDAEGVFSLTWNGPDRFDASVECPGFAPLRRPNVEVGDRSRFELDAAGAIAGRVLGPSAEELLQGSVTLRGPATDRRGRGLEAGIAEDGSFEIGGLVAGQYSLGLQVPGWSLLYESALPVAVAERVEVVLEPALGATVHGRLLTRERREPVAGARIVVEPELQGVSGSIEELGRIEGRSEVDGSFALSGLSVGRNRLRVTAPSGAVLGRDVSVADAGERLGPIELLLDEPASLAGRVVDGSGGGCGGARVEAVWSAAAFAGNRGEAGETGERRDHAQVEADAMGRFRFESLPPGRGIDVVAHRGSPEAPEADALGFHPSLVLRSGERREGFEIVVRAPVTRRGVVRDLEGRGIEGVRVQARRRNRGYGGSWASRASDGEGRFQLAGLLPGEHVVELRHPDFLSARERLSISPEDGAELAFTLSPAANVTGWVIDEWGNGIASARVRATCPELAGGDGDAPSERARGDEYGRFELERLAPGRWGVLAWAAGHEAPTGPAWVDAPGGGAIVITLRRALPLERAVVLGHAVLPEGGSPRALRFDNLRGGSLSQEGSRFRLSGVRPGEARFTLQADGCVPVRLGPLRLPPGGEVDVGVIQLQLSAALTVFVRARGGGPLTRHKARLLPLPPASGGTGGRAITLGRRSLQHRWSGEGARRRWSAAYSSAVPVGSWRLVVDHSGYQRYQKTIHFTREKRRRTVEVELPRKTGSRSKKKRGGS